MLKRMGNKGFAITGILYTLLILFLMILLSVLAGLSARKNMFESSTKKLEESYLGKKDEDSVISINSGTINIAPVDGKYVFELSGGGSSINCVVYLKEGDEISAENLNGKYIPKDCGDYEYTFSFVNPDPLGLKMELKSVYTFGEE